MSNVPRIGNLRDLRPIPDPDGTLRESAFSALVRLVEQQTSGDAFLGDTAPAAAEAYRKSLIGRYFPSFWMEVPFLGSPGFDLHVYYDCSQVAPSDRFAEGCGFGMQALFDWFFNVETGGVGVGFAHDLRDGSGAVGTYVNFNRHPLDNVRGFFTSLGADESYGCMSALLDRLPSTWTPWYVGLFPERVDAGVRVGAFVSQERQAAYAANPHVLADDLARVGFTAFDDMMLKRISELAAMPFMLELQLDATEEGVGDTLGVDLTLESASTGSTSALFAESAPAWKACKLLESWGMADSRWQCIPDASISRAIPIKTEGGDAILAMGSTPTFIKAKWVATHVQPAKVYLHCTARLFGFPANTADTE